MLVRTSKNSDMMASIPTRARITVRRGAAGKDTLVLNSSIFTREKKNEIIRNVPILPVDTVWSEIYHVVIDRLSSIDIIDISIMF